MKVLENFIDCVYEANLYNKNIDFIKKQLVKKLPDIRIADLANVLMIKTKYNIYAVKIRMCYYKEDGSIDTETIHNEIHNSDFIEISDDDYMYNRKNITKRTNELIKIGSNVIFTMKNLNEDTLIQEI